MWQSYLKIKTDGTFSFGLQRLTNWMARGGFCQFLFANAKFVLRYITEWSIYTLALSMPKASVCDIFYLLEIWNKCVCVVWLVRWSLVSCHMFENYCRGERVTAQPHSWLALCGTFTCATFVSGICIMTLLLVLVSELHVWPLVCVIRKHQSDNHLGFAQAIYESFLQTCWANLKQPACISVIRKVSPLEGIISSINDSYCHPSNICYGSSFYSLIW